MYNLDLAVSIIPELAVGALITILLVIVSFPLGVVLIAIPFGLMANAKRAWLRYIFAGFDFVFRGTPLIVLLYIIYYGVATIGVVRENPILWLALKEPIFCGVVALVLNTGAYGAEIVRGAIASVPKGLIESGQSLGLSRFQLYRLIIGPIALRHSIAPYGHELIVLIKSTAVLSTITIIDLMGAANHVYADTFDPFTPLLTAGAVYLALVWLITRGMYYLEKRLYPEHVDI